MTDDKMWMIVNKELNKTSAEGDGSMTSYHVIFQWEANASQNMQG